MCQLGVCDLILTSIPYFLLCFLLCISFAVPSSQMMIILRTNHTSGATKKPPFSMKTVQFSQPKAFFSSYKLLKLFNFCLYYRCLCVYIISLLSCESLNKRGSFGSISSPSNQVKMVYKLSIEKNKTEKQSLVFTLAWFNSITL